MKKILIGICGIANGHVYRQIPVIDFLLEKNCQIMIFSYVNSFDICSQRYKNNPWVKVVQVSVPFYKGNNHGIDFNCSESHENTCEINLNAFTLAQDWLGKPDLVISDYEPNAAIYSYAYDVDLITHDQQSKYLSSDFPQPLNNCFYNDEKMRLRMFFPKAKKRVVCSFFNFIHDETIILVQPLIRKEILKIKNKPDKNINFVIYISQQVKDIEKFLNPIISIIKNRQEIFHVFLNHHTEAKNDYPNIEFHFVGDDGFEKYLESCHGLICTAGHSLLTEAMHLNIPVYALALNLYEQQLSAHIIEQNGFGVMSQIFEEKKLNQFISHLSCFRNNIIQDNEILIKKNYQTMNEILKNHLFL